MSGEELKLEVDEPLLLGLLVAACASLNLFLDRA